MSLEKQSQGPRRTVVASSSRSFSPLRVRSVPIPIPLATSAALHGDASSTSVDQDLCRASPVSSSPRLARGSPAKDEVLGPFERVAELIEELDQARLTLIKTAKALRVQPYLTRARVALEAARREVDRLVGLLRSHVRKQGEARELHADLFAQYDTLVAALPAAYEMADDALEIASAGVDTRLDVAATRPPSRRPSRSSRARVLASRSPSPLVSSAPALQSLSSARRRDFISYAELESRDPASDEHAAELELLEVEVAERKTRSLGEVQALARDVATLRQLHADLDELVEHQGRDVQVLQDSVAEAKAHVQRAESELKTTHRYASRRAGWRLALLGGVVGALVGGPAGAYFGAKAAGIAGGALVGAGAAGVVSAAVYSAKPSHSSGDESTLPNPLPSESAPASFEVPLPSSQPVPSFPSTSPSVASCTSSPKPDLSSSSASPSSLPSSRRDAPFPVSPQAAFPGNAIDMPFKGW